MTDSVLSKLVDIAINFSSAFAGVAAVRLLVAPRIERQLSEASRMRREAIDAYKESGRLLAVSNAALKAVRADNERLRVENIQLRAENAELRGEAPCVELHS